MNLQDYQTLRKLAYGRHTEGQERLDAQAAFDVAEKAGGPTGTVFVPVYFGYGNAKGESADDLAAQRGISKAKAKAAIKAATVVIAGVACYDAADVAWAVARDRMGMGNCSNVGVCECDPTPEAVCACSISESEGDGWRMVGHN
jgi:hypothetical protein